MPNKTPTICTVYYRSTVLDLSGKRAWIGCDSKVSSMARDYWELFGSDGVVVARDRDDLPWFRTYGLPSDAVVLEVLDREALHAWARPL